MDLVSDDSVEESCDKDQNYITNRLPNTNVLIKGKNFEFAIGRLIYHGRFCAVYEVLRRTDGRRFAAKLEVCDKHSHGLDMDYIVLRQSLNIACEHIAGLIDHGKIEGHFKFIIMKMLGDNLHKLRHSFVECHFSLSTSLRLGIQTLAALRELHSLGFVHRDIKASNFAINHSSESKMNVYIIDFGLCRMYQNPKDGIKPPRNKTSFRGTARYASLAAHREHEISPKDDIESWFYMLIEMISGELPWSSIHRTDRKEIEQRKEQCRSSDALKTLLKDCPKLRCRKYRKISEIFLQVEFRRILNYIDSLTYHSQPDYTFLTEMLQLAMKNYNVAMDEPYDWDDELQTQLNSSGS